MGRRLILLNGLAIIAVVSNHAAGWGYTAMFWWAHQYLPVISPNFDQVNSPTYFGLVIIEQLALFSVPAFLFVSGFFVAYAAKGGEQKLSWKIVQIRILHLLWPYLIWSMIIFIINGLQGQILTPTQYIYQLLTGGATPAYFYVILLCQFYLLSPLIVWLAKNHPVLLLISAAIIQLTAISLLYLQFTILNLSHATNSWLFVWRAFYFPLGVVVGFWQRPVQQFIARFRWVLIAATIALAICSILESVWLYHVSAPQQFDPQLFAWSHSFKKFSSSLYSVVFILAYLSFDVKRGQLTQTIGWIGAMSYGIYLIHPKLQQLTARLIYHFAPWLLSQQLLLMLVLIVVGIGIPILIMEIVARSPMRKSYRYLFG